MKRIGAVVLEGRNDAPDTLDLGKIDIRDAVSHIATGVRQNHAPGIDDERMTACAPVARMAAGLAGREDEGAAFDSPLYGHAVVWRS